MQRLPDRPLDAQPLHFPVQRVAADAEIARDVADVAVLEIELPEQRLALGSAERVERVRLGKRSPALGSPRAKAVLGGQVSHVELVARAPRNHGAQRVAQLPYVPPPVMGAERVDQLLAERHRRRVGCLLREHVRDQRALVGSVIEPRQRQHQPLQPIEEILAKLTASIFSSRLEGLAAIRRISRFSSTWSSRACSAPGSSPISSRNSVPPWACTISLCSSASGIAAQLTATNACSARSLEACKARAKSSLPVPVSPISRIGTSREATRFAARMLRAIDASPRSSSSSALRLARGSNAPLRGADSGSCATAKKRPPWRAS